ncbi:MAG: hypothetical protein Q7R49_01895 [Candidatus Daviesbacteria bacterium]|nr:hypothetical protein [Candidatus Daviesbacteria bacterium]
MLESLGQTNIGHLNLEEPRNTDIFDPDKDITKSDWNRAFRVLADLRPKTLDYNYEVGLYAGHAVNMNIVDPGCTPYLSLDATKLAEFVEDGFRYEPLDYSRSYYYLKMLYPEKFALHRIDRDEIRRVLSRSKYNGKALLNTAFDFAITSPITYAAGKLDNDENFVKIKKVIEEEKLYLRAPDNYWVFLSMAKVAFPSHFSQFGEKETLLQGSARVAQHFASGDEDHYFMDVAAAMKILWADEIKITNQGMDLIRYHSFKTTVIPALPEVRKF